MEIEMNAEPLSKLWKPEIEIEKKEVPSVAHVARDLAFDIDPLSVRYQRDPKSPMLWRYNQATDIAERMADRLDRARCYLINQTRIVDFIKTEDPGFIEIMKKFSDLESELRSFLIQRADGMRE